MVDDAKVAGISISSSRAVVSRHGVMIIAVKLNPGRVVVERVIHEMFG